jgi:hypothetical protein
LQVEISSPVHGNKIYYYTSDPEGNKSSYEFYSTPFSVKKTIKVYAFCDNNGNKSDTVMAIFHKRPNHWKIRIESKYNPQYTAGGDEGIIDGLNGTENWRKGDWQGYQNQNFVAIIDMLKTQPLTTVTSGYLQDTRSWILFPSEVKYSFSIDGINFTDFGVVPNNIPADNYDIQIKRLSKTVSVPVKARYVKVEAINFGKLPEWHQGAGEDAFVFIDEIEIK